MCLCVEIRGQFWELLLSSHHVDPRDWTWDIRLSITYGATATALVVIFKDSIRQDGEGKWGGPGKGKKPFTEEYGWVSETWSQVTKPRFSIDPIFYYLRDMSNKDIKTNETTYLLKIRRFVILTLDSNNMPLPCPNKTKHLIKLVHIYKRKLNKKKNK